MKNNFIPCLLALAIACLYTFPLSAQHWEQQSGGQSSSYQHVKVLNQNKILVFGAPALLNTSLDKGNNWDKASNLPLGIAFNKVFFLNEDLGWSFNDIGNTFKTTDGGATWQQINTVELGYPVALHFWDNQSGYAIHYNYKNNDRVVSRTTDGGQTWTVFTAIGYNSTASLAALQFLGDVGYLSGINNIQKTSDKGITWQTLQFPKQPNQDNSFSHIHFVDATTGWLVEASRRELYSTADGGTTWNQVPLTGVRAGSIIADIYFTDANTGWVLENNGLILYTPDGGDNWSEVYKHKVDVRFTDLEVSPDGNTLVAISREPAFAIVSTDGGQTWNLSLEESPVRGLLKDIVFLDNETGWAVGENTLLAKTTDGGQTWSKVNLDLGIEGYTFTNISFSNSQNGWITSSDEEILVYTNDGGQTWDLDFGPAHPLFYPYAIYDSFFLKQPEDNSQPAKGWAVGGNGGIILSYDGGVWSMQQQSFGMSPMEYNAVFFLNDQIGWVAGMHGIIAKTTDGGATWAKQSTGTLRTLNDIQFINEQVGYAVGDHDYILKTTDGGQTWRQQALEPGFVAHLKSVHFTSEHRGWVVGESDHRGKKLFTTNGGHTWTSTAPDAAPYNAVYFTDLNNGWAAGEAGAITKFSDNATGAGDVTPSLPVLQVLPEQLSLRNFAPSIPLVDSVLTVSGVDYSFIGMSDKRVEEFGERYDITGEAYVLGVVSYHGGQAFHMSDNVAEVNIFDLDQNGLPNYKRGRKDVMFKDVKTDHTAMMTTFDQPVPVKQAFVVSFNFTDYAHGGFDGDQLSLMHTSNAKRPVSDHAVKRNLMRIHSHDGRIWQDLREQTGYSGHLGLFPIVQFVQTNGLADQSIKAGNLRLFAPYPNPSAGSFTIAYELATPAAVELTLTDLTGKSVYRASIGRAKAGKHEHWVQQNNLKPGVYIVLLTSGSQHLATRVLIH